MNAFFIFGAVAVGLLAIFRDPIQETVEEFVATERNKAFDPLFKKYGKIYDVPWEWLAAIAENESRTGRERSVARGLASPADVDGSKSSDGKSWGIMQVTLTTARDMDKSATEIKLNNPEYSVNLAAQYLKKLSSLFSKLDLRYREWVIKSYNQGPGNTRKEIASGKGFADEYYARFERNLKKILEET